VQEVGSQVTRLDAKLRRLLKQAGIESPGKITVDAPRSERTKSADGKHLLGMNPQDYYCSECHSHIGMFCFDGGTRMMNCHRCNKTVTLTTKGEEGR
jgi:transposase-like protein